MNAITQISFPDLKPTKQGKVRALFDLGKELLLVATDRISAFDHVFAEGIPGKGRVLTGISLFWFNLLSDVPNHLITADVNKFPIDLQRYADVLSGRSMLVKKAKVIPIECIVRGYLEGSGWKEYQKSQTVCGQKLPPNLKQGSKLPEAIFTPSTKAEHGHDENISIEKMYDIIGKDLGEIIRKKSLSIYNRAVEYALKKGIIIADTKFEFGIDENGEVILIDEVLTPDSSRFWDVTKYKEGQSQQSYDKQFVRDYLESIKWNKEPPVPHLPEDIIAKTSEKYLEVYKRLTA